MNKIKEILDFWFEGLNNDSVIDPKAHSVKKWFIKDEKFDNEIRERFEGDITRAANGEYRDWEDDPKGRMALTVLFDQFPRNIYRNTGKMFEFDPKALGLTLGSIKDGADKDYSLIERTFLYLPLEHSEDIAMQELSLTCYESLVKDAERINPQNAQYFKYNLDYSKKHYDIIKQFGRFPHRNALLGRASTPKEEEFLKTPGSSF